MAYKYTGMADRATSRAEVAGPADYMMALPPRTCIRLIDMVGWRACILCGCDRAIVVWCSRRRWAKCGISWDLFPRPRRNEYHESVPPDPLPARIGRPQATGLLLLSMALLSAGIGVFRAYAPSVDLVHLQWAGSATVANKIVHQTAYGPYRVALYYDLAALVPGFTFGLIAADYLGRRVFWTHLMRVAAVAGIWAAAVAGFATSPRMQSC